MQTGGQVINNVIPVEREVKDSIPELTYDYPDPFLKRLNRPVTASTQPKKDEKPVLRRVVRWPRVEYKGCVNSHGKKDVLGLLVINDKEYLVRNEQIFSEVMVMDIQSDSIGLQYQDDKRYFHIKPHY